MKSTLFFSIVCAAAPLSHTALANMVNTLNVYSFTSQCQGAAGATNSGCSVSNSNGSATAGYGLNSSTGPDVTVSASGALNAPTGDNAGNGQGELVYQIEATGPTNTVKVDVNYLLTLAGQYTTPLGNDESASILTGTTFTVGPNTIASAQINLSASGGSSENSIPPSFSDTSSNASCSATTGDCNGSLSGPQTITLTTGLAYNVALRVQASCSAQSPGNAYENCSTSASIDPTFKIDPSQANAGQYSLEFSPGVGNGSPASMVPEPALMLPLGVGLVGLGALRRRRRVVL
jgi:hypothetical protein